MLEDDRPWVRVDAGDEHYELENMNGHADQTRHMDGIQEKREHRLRAPAFDLYLTNRSVPEGATIKLTCCISGQNYKVRWYKEDLLLALGRKYRMIDCDGLITFEVPNATTADTGTYRCVISNASDQIESSAIVDVYEKYDDTNGNIPPTFTRSIRGKWLPHYYFIENVLICVLDQTILVEQAFC